MPSNTARRIPPTTSAEHETIIAISDQGYGITADELPYIFKRFHRQRQTEISGEKGAGLGLNFVQVVVSKHKGKIEVDSEPDTGTTFTLSFPLSESNPS